MAATPFLKRRQQVLKPRNSLDMLLMLKPSLSFERGQHRRDRQWRGIVGSAGVLERGKGTGRIAWEPAPTVPDLLFAPPDEAYTALQAARPHLIS